MYCVRMCLKAHHKILYILKVPFRVGGVLGYIYKQKRKQNINHGIRS